MATQSSRKFAVITAASTGIGYELARECLEHDFDVLLCAEDSDVFTAARKLMQIGPTVQAIQVDLATREGCDELIGAVDRPVDALLLNAGVGVGGAFIDNPLAEELRLIALNCNHTVQVAKGLVPGMVERKQGRVLITGPEVSRSPDPSQAVYGATKAFVMSFGEALRWELEDTGVTVTVLQPGVERADPVDCEAGRPGKNSPALIARQCFDAMMDGKDSVAGGGFQSRMQTFMNEMRPEAGTPRPRRKLAKPRSPRH